MDVLSKPVPIADLSAQTSFTVYDQPCLLRKIYVNETTNAYPIIILDDAVGQFAIPASLVRCTATGWLSHSFWTMASFCKVYHLCVWTAVCGCAPSYSTRSPYSYRVPDPRGQQEKWSY